MLGFSGFAAFASDDANAVKNVTIRAPRDMGYFAGDLVKADIEIVVADSYAIEEPSLPHPGPIVYWLDLRRIDVTSRSGPGATTRYTLHILYQNFYDALDARPQEIPTFPVSFTNGKDQVSANVPAWTIGVSSLREVAPPIKSDPRDYLRADESAPFKHAGGLWWSAAFAALATILAAMLLAYDRAWWIFRSRPARVFAEASRKLKDLARQDSAPAYLEALLVLHRGIDRTDGQRVLADDLPVFLDRHPVFAPQREGFARFFSASRCAFFGSDPSRARADLGFGALQSFARQLAVTERSKP